jgi:hypothetical protein
MARLSPRLERLEDRLVLFRFQVNNTLDTAAANRKTGKDVPGYILLRSAIAEVTRSLEERWTRLTLRLTPVARLFLAGVAILIACTCQFMES